MRVVNWLSALSLPLVALPSTARAASVEVQPNLDVQQCMDVVDRSRTDGAGVQLWKCAASDNQLWTQSGDLLKVYGTSCLDVVDGADNNGTPVQIWACDAGNRNQQWQRDGRLLRWKGTDKCLHIWRGQTQNGGRLQIRTCDKTNDRQAFRLITTGSAKSTTPATPSTSTPVTGSNATGAGSFLGYSYIALDDFLAKHPVLQSMRQDIIDAAATGTPALPPQLLAAIAMEESSGNPTVSGGLMQFTNAQTWAAYGQGDINNARNSLFAAARYISALLKETNNDLSKSLQEYNGYGNSNYLSEIKLWLSGGFPYGAGT